jgi:hypothetical protein
MTHSFVFPYRLIGCRDDAPPPCFVLTCDGSSKCPPIQLTLYRDLDESPANWWARVEYEWSCLNRKSERYGGKIVARYDKREPPAGTVNEDFKANILAVLWHVAEHDDPHAETRVEAATLLAEQIGMLPPGYTDSFYPRARTKRSGKLMGAQAARYLRVLQ